MRAFSEKIEPTLNIVSTILEALGLDSIEKEGHEATSLFPFCLLAATMRVVLHYTLAVTD